MEVLALVFALGVMTAAVFATAMAYAVGWEAVQVLRDRLARRRRDASLWDRELDA